MSEFLREMLISHDSNETRVALLEDRQLVELYIERPKRSVVGNVYVGKVKDVLPGMQAAFVDIGLEKNAFLYVDEVISPEGVEDLPRRDIQTLLHPGQQIMVQVLKDPMGTKGARVTTEITLPGRFLVLMPFSEFVGVSRKIEEAERDRLHTTISQHVPAGLGVIVRTVAVGVSERDLLSDLDFLLRLWKRVNHQSREGVAPEVIYTELDLALRLVRDVFSDDFKRMIIDDKGTYEKVLSFLKKTSPHLARRVQPYRDKLPLFDVYQLQASIDAALRRVVHLSSGGHITIDKTEALTAIDVNTGKFVGRKNLEETIFKTNMEAADEVVRQLRLRDIGGIIVIDFIDMEESGHRAELLAQLNSALERDRTKTRVSEISRLGLVEMTRKNVTDGLYGVLTEPCPCCTGEGRTLSSATRRITVERRMREILRQGKSAAYLFGVHEETYELLMVPGHNLVATLRAETGKQVAITPDSDCAPTEVRVLIEGKGGAVKQRG
ncbi:MAG: ribonuclease E/G [Actinobacteria bacterium HGW-Actinobacteria-9]|nr:MAG: ribonuclease E/G [Actinobacteria bacterium HGW-Actinobacteria-9]